MRQFRMQAYFHKEYEGLEMIFMRDGANKADRHKSRAPINQRPTDGPTDQPIKRLIELRARD